LGDEDSSDELESFLFVHAAGSDLGRLAETGGFHKGFHVRTKRE
jgi:hypothetical protein